MTEIILPPFTMDDIPMDGKNDGPPIYTRATITPTLAEQMLTRNTRNRPLSERLADTYARDMQAGNWHENGDGTRFDWHGVLLDGQHTLTAVKRAGVSVNMLVVTNLRPETQATMDGGKKRSAQDMFSLAGEANASTVASITIRVWKWDRGDRRLNGPGPTRAEQAAVLERYPSIRRSAERAVYIRHNFPFIPASAAGTAHHLLNQVSPDDAALFTQRLADGLGLQQGDPVTALRRKLMNNTDNNNTGARLKRTDARLLTYIIMAWNASREGRPLERVQYSEGASIPDPK